MAHGRHLAVGMKKFREEPGVHGISGNSDPFCSRLQHSRCSDHGPALPRYPDRLVKIVVPFAPGGGTDVVARTLAQEMAKDLGVSVIVENKPGAGTIIGTQAVATSEPDGYTLLMGTFANAVNPSLQGEAAL